MTSTTQPRQPHTANWWFKSAGHITIWIGGAAAFFVTVGIASTGGADATRFNMPGILIAAGILAIAGAFFTAAALTKDRAVYYDATIEDAADYDLVETAR